MAGRLRFAASLAAALLLVVGVIRAQDAAAPATGEQAWHKPDETTAERRAAAGGAPQGAADVTLPNSAGQIWREYDLSPYTLRVTTTVRPEQAVIEWILRETGYETWHGEPLGILSATDRTLRVYHTPEIQARVAEIVDRFVSTQAESHAFGFRIITMGSPGWRLLGQRIMRPLQTRSPGIQSWLLEKEDSAMLLAELRRRSDFREHSSPHLLVSNGQPTILSSMQPRNYVADLFARPGSLQGVETLVGQVEEGYAAEFVPLVSADGRMIDAFVRCNINQIEKMVPVMLDAAVAGTRQRVRIDVPQTTQFRFEERFCWPADKVLLIGMGMVALPTPTGGTSLVAGIPLPLPSAPPRADVLVFVENRSTGVTAQPGVRSAQQPARPYQRRY